MSIQKYDDKRHINKIAIILVFWMNYENARKVEKLRLLSWMKAVLASVTTTALTLTVGGNFSEPAFAAGEECIHISNDLDRLACYDKELGRTPVFKAVRASAGKWSVITKESKLTDQTNVFLHVESDEAVNCGWNKGEKISLVVRCVEDKTSLIIATGCHMTSSRYNSYGDVTYRLDDEKAKTASMVESTNNRSLGLWGGGKSIPVIKQMFGKSRMVVRATPYGESSFTATFDVSGLEEAIRPMREACHW